MNDILEIPPLFEGEDTEEIHTQVKQLEEYRRLKRRWENALQRWSDENSIHGTDSYGCCGFGVICYYCKDNSVGVLRRMVLFVLSLRNANLRQRRRKHDGI